MTTPVACCRSCSESHKLLGFLSIPNVTVAQNRKGILITPSGPQAWPAIGRSYEARKIFSHLDSEKEFEQNNKRVCNKFCAAGCLLIEKQISVRGTERG